MTEIYDENHSHHVKIIAKLLETENAFEQRVKKNEAIAKRYMD